MEKKIISVVISLAILISVVLCGCKDTGNKTGNDTSSDVSASSSAGTASGSENSSSGSETQGDASENVSNTSSDASASSETTASKSTGSEGTSSDILDTDEPTVYLKASQSGETVTVTGYIKNNPGIAGMSIRIDYDTSLVTPKKIEGKLMSVTSNLQQEGIDPDGSVTVVYVSPSGMTDNGELFTVTFKKEKTGLATFKLMAGDNSFVSPETKYVKVNAVGYGITLI